MPCMGGLEPCLLLNTLKLSISRAYKTLHKMEHLNHNWFTQINADSYLQGYKLWLAIFIAKYLIFLVAIFLAGMWLWGSKQQRYALVLALVAVVVGLVINWCLGMIWYHPRPFMIGMGNAFLSHDPNSSFPSDHATILGTISIIFLLQKETRFVGYFMIASTLLVAWGRIYVGIHYPFDMIGAIIVALISASIVRPLFLWIENHLLPCIEHLYRLLFSKAIALKWVKY